MHEDGAAPPASTIATALTCSGKRGDSFFLPEDHHRFLPTSVVRLVVSGEANIFCSAFETERHAE